MLLLPSYQVMTSSNVPQFNIADLAYSRLFGDLVILVYRQ